MKVVLDLNVLLDVIQQREPFYEASAAVLSLVTRKKITGFVPGHALPTIYYIVMRYASRAEADKAIDWLLSTVAIAAEDIDVFRHARSLSITDFEDAVVASVGEAAGCSHIVTRNFKDFTGSPVPALTPEEFLAYCAQPPAR